MPQEDAGMAFGYVPPADCYDELLLPSGAMRPHWHEFASSLAKLGPEGLSQRAGHVERLLREGGVTSNFYGATTDVDQPWELDPIPLLISVAEWQQLEAGLKQRVRLLNRLLQDVYGPQDALRAGILPPSFVFEHPGFLRACFSVATPLAQYLHLYSAQLTRAPNGSWIVVADRTQGPSGSGYAVENRIVVARALPQEFHGLHVERLASFFITLRETLSALAPRHSDNPRIVLLSPGPHSSRYFEDTYLARYLGYELAEGGDLTVRTDGVFLKTLGGLLPVDVIFRRVLDDDSDPLELRSDSLLGVPGLVEAVRAGHVVIANALGSGYLEAPALPVFLPQLCRYYFDEPLVLQSLPTWWCGRSDDLNYVLEHLDELIIRSAYQHRREPTFGWKLTAAERDALRTKISARPHEFAAQAPQPQSSAPTWTNDKIQPGFISLRAFAVASGREYDIMPGGLARTSLTREPLSESLSAGERGKDVWVLADGPVEPVTLLRRTAKAVELRRSVNNVPSRVADHLYWLGRMVERTEARVRHLRSLVSRLTSEPQPGSIPGVRALLAAYPGFESETEAPAVIKDVECADVTVQADEDLLWNQMRMTVLQSLFSRSDSSLHEMFHTVRYTASVVRDRISLDSWRLINQLQLPDEDSDSSLGDALMVLTNSLNLLSAFSGLTIESMTRSAGWRFLDVGRRLERALQTLDLVEALFGTETDDTWPLLEAMLDIADSSMTYRYRYMATLQLPPVLDLVLVDETNPRAVGFQLSALAEHLRSFKREKSWSVSPTREQEFVMAMQGMLRLADVESLSELTSDDRRGRLSTFVQLLSARLRSLSDSLTHTYLTHTPAARLFGSATPTGGTTGSGKVLATPRTAGQADAGR